MIFLRYDLGYGMIEFKPENVDLAASICVQNDVTDYEQTEAVISDLPLEVTKTKGLKIIKLYHKHPDSEMKRGSPL